MRVSQILLAGGAAFLLLFQGLSPSSNQQMAAAASSAAGNAAGDVDPDAVAALDRMSGALRTHDVFVVTAEVTNEDVLQDGQKLQFGGTLDIRARRPDRFKISTTSASKNREMFYDGKTLTIFSPNNSMYASFAAPPTIRETIDKAQSKFAIELPLADLFTWNSDSEQAKRLTSGFLVQQETVGGHACDHYAFRQKDVDWEVWIAKDASALPYKLVITDRRDPSMPQYAAVLHWNFPDKLDDATFAFSPPSGAKKIVMADIETMKRQMEKEEKVLK
jgi:hypothetical protein